MIRARPREDVVTVGRLTLAKALVEFAALVFLPSKELRRVSRRSMHICLECTDRILEVLIFARTLVLTGELENIAQLTLSDILAAGEPETRLRSPILAQLGIKGKGPRKKGCVHDGKLPASVRNDLLKAVLLFVAVWIRMLIVFLGVPTLSRRRWSSTVNLVGGALGLLATVVVRVSQSEP